MKSIAQFARCILRWGGGGSALIGALLYVLYLLVVMAHDIAQAGGWPYGQLFLTYFFIELIVSAFVGFIIGVLLSLVNGVLVSILIMSYHLRGKVANFSRRWLGLMFATVSGLGVLVIWSNSELPGALFYGLPPVIVWILSVAVPAMMASAWAWRVSGKAPILKQEN